MTHSPIPNALRKYRKQYNMRQIDVAKKLGFKSTDRISRWEAGIAFPHPRNLLKLSVIFKVPLEELYTELISSLKTDIKDMYVS